MRITYATSSFTRWLSSTKKSIVRLFTRGTLARNVESLGPAETRAAENALVKRQIGSPLLAYLR